MLFLNFMILNNIASINIYLTTFEHMRNLIRISVYEIFFINLGTNVFNF